MTLTALVNDPLYKVAVPSVIFPDAVIFTAPLIEPLFIDNVPSVSVADDKLVNPDTVLARPIVSVSVADTVAVISLDVPTTFKVSPVVTSCIEEVASLKKKEAVLDSVSLIAATTEVLLEVFRVAKSPTSVLKSLNVVLNPFIVLVVATLLTAILLV